MRSMLARLVMVLMLLGSLLILAAAPTSALAAGSLHVESSSGGGTTACKTLSISELSATSTKGGGHAFVDLSLADTCGGAGLSTVASGTLSAGDLRGNRNQMSLRTTLVDEWGNGTVVTLDVTFRCWAPATVSPGEASCPATLSGTVTVDGTAITLDPSTDAFMSRAK